MDHKLSEPRKRQKLAHPTASISPTTLCDLFKHSCELHPSRISVEYVEYDNAAHRITSTSLTYAELMSHVRDINVVLVQQYTVQRGHVIGVLGPATPDTLAALLAVMFSGAVYAPIEVHNSRAPDLQMTCVIGTSEQLSSAAHLIGNTPHLVLPVARDTTAHCDMPMTRDTDDAYVMWTSGTTSSSPTRVTVPHSAVLPNLTSLSEALDLNSDTQPLRTILVAPMTFDPSMIDLFLALGYGGTVVVPSPAIKLMPKLFIDTVTSHHVTTLQCTPSFIRRISPDLRSTLFSAPSLRHVILGGEQFPTVSELKQWLGTANTSNLRLFNIYGITEVSVWATLESVNVTRLLMRKSDQYVPSLGTPMRDTQLALRTEDNRFVLLAPYLQQRALKHNKNELNNTSTDGYLTRDQVLSGQLLIGSQRRRCRLNDEVEPQEWRETGDLVRVVRGKVYYMGRAQDCLVKVNGKRINLQEISNTLKSCPAVSEVVVLALDLSGLVCYVVSPVTDAVTAVNQFARQHLPAFMRPNHVIIVDNMPSNLNGKIDKTALRALFNAQVIHSSNHSMDRTQLVDMLLHLWRSTVPGLEGISDEHTKGQHFVALGASSIEVLECSEKLLAQLGLNGRVNSMELRQRVHDALLHHKFEGVIELLVTLVTDSSLNALAVSNETSPVILSTLLGTPVRATSRCNNVVTFEPNTHHSHRATVNSVQFTSAALKWQQWMIKCVDASPLIVETTQQRCVVIGSHSGHVTCMELHSGEIIWRTQLPDRVETSAALIKVQQQFYICVGCYDGLVYFLNASDGIVTWTYDLQGQVKSSAAQDPITELVWIGAHSGTLAVLDISQRKCVMSHSFAAPLFAVPCVDTTRQLVYVAVEDNFLYAFNSTTLKLDWKLNLEAPLFSSPVITSQGTVIVGGVNKVITAVSTAGTVLWQYRTEGPVFSSPALLTHLDDECVVCGCHDGNIYCLDLNGALKWKKQLGDKPIFSSVFVGSTDHTAVIAACTISGEISTLNATGELLTRVKCLGEVFSSPVLVESLLVVGCRDDCVYCFEFE